VKRLRSISIGAIMAIGLTAAVISAAASADPVTGGKTVLKLDPDTAEGLADMSIGVTTTGAGKDGKNGLSFPIKGGDVKEGPKGEITHRGGLGFFTEGGPGVKFTQFIVKIGTKKTKVFAKSDHAAVRFMDLDLSDATISGSAGANLKIKGADATLAKAGANVLSSTFDFPFRKGIPLGTVTIKAAVGS
jgi:hypothetical protein